MNNWQETRNYRKAKDESGNVTAYIITVEGQDVEVGEEIFLMYSQSDRRERYLIREAEVGKQMSLEQLEEDEMYLEYLTSEHVPSAEEKLIEEETEQEHQLQLSLLKTALEMLEEEDRALINALYFEGLSTRQYAEKTGVTQRAVMKKKQRIINALKNFSKNNGN